MTLVRPESLGVPPPVRALAERLGEAGGRLLLVGGWVRDGCLGLAARDLDVELYDLDPATAFRVLREAGLETIEVAGRHFPVLLARGAGFEPFEISLVERSGEPDPDAGFTRRAAERAGRRDLTLNAMALDPLTGECFDARGGFEDLASRRLRAVDPRRFGEDPLRVLRVARLAAWLEAEPDRELLACCRAQDLSQLAVERIFRELDRLLCASRPSLGLRVLHMTRGLAPLPELAALEGVPQDPRWHPEGCVWTHTLMVVDEAAALRSGDAERDGRLMWSALLHDLGKPRTTRREAGAVRSHGHGALGAGLAAALLERLRAPRATVAAVEALVRHHLAPALLIAQESSDRGFRRLARRLARAGVDADLLQRVARADHFGRTTQDARARRFAAGDEFVARMQSLETLGGPPAVRVRGRDVIAAGLEPGPAVGAVLARCEAIGDETGWTDPARILERALREHRGAAAD